MVKGAKIHGREESGRFHHPSSCADAGCTPWSMSVVFKEESQRRPELRTFKMRTPQLTELMESDNVNLEGDMTETATAFT